LKRNGVKKSYAKLVRLMELANLAASGRNRPRLQKLAERIFVVPEAALPAAALDPGRWLAGKMPDYIALDAARLASDMLRLAAKGDREVSFPLRQAPMVAVDRYGIFRRVWDEADVIIEILSGREAARLRACPVCDKPFVALRVDQHACRGRCTNTWNVREFRRKKPRYEENRKKNAAVKKRRAALKAARQENENGQSV
jgi:hypothetical protein